MTIPRSIKTALKPSQNRASPGEELRAGADRAQNAQQEIDRLKALNAEMLAALRLAVPYTMSNNVDLHREDCRCAYHRCRAVIAKAEGR